MRVGWAGGVAVALAALGVLGGGVAAAVAVFGADDRDPPPAHRLSTLLRDGGRVDVTVGMCSQTRSCPSGPAIVADVATANTALGRLDGVTGLHYTGPAEEYARAAELLPQFDRVALLELGVFEFTVTDVAAWPAVAETLEGLPGIDWVAVRPAGTPPPR